MVEFTVEALRKRAEQLRQQERVYNERALMAKGAWQMLEHQAAELEKTKETK